MQRNETVVWVVGSTTHDGQHFVLLEGTAYIPCYCHGHRTSDHFGRDQSVEWLVRCYYWPGMRQDIKSWIETCLTCCLGLVKLPLIQEWFGVWFVRVMVDIIIQN